MISIELGKKGFWDHQVDAYLFLMEEQFAHHTDIGELERSYYPHLRAILDKHKFQGKAGQSVVLTAERAGKLATFIFVGVSDGKASQSRSVELLRRAMGTLVQHMKRLSIKTAVLHAPQASYYDMELPELLKQMAVSAYLASYEFITFKRDKASRAYDGSITIVADSQDRDALQEGITHGLIIGRAMNKSRHYCDMPPNIVFPEYMSNAARELAKEHGLKCTVFGREKALELNMGGFCCVDEGSDKPGQFVVLEYTGARKGAPTIALVGKGVTFDSGGISLKPSNSMTGMKYDMSGAAAVIAVMEVVAQLKPNVNVIGLMPFVENMPSGKSSRQDDIVTFMNGKTAEIESTDAEGRLILADAMCYAEQYYKPDIMIDIATLTGACVVALGHYFTALMTRDDELSSLLFTAGNKTGDRVWPLPLDEDFQEAIRSDVADLINCGKRGYSAGTITAGLFLEHFVEKARWVHLDIAGSAHDVLGINYVGRGSSGAAIRLLVEVIQQLSAQQA